MKCKWLSIGALHMLVVCLHVLFLESAFGSTLHIPSSPKMTEIYYPDFRDVSSLQINGDASRAITQDGRYVLRLTQSEELQQGSFFVKEPIPLIGANGFKASFSAYARFTISNPGGVRDEDGPGADGIVFVVQTVANTVGSTGGGIGFAGINRSLGIEFDTYFNRVPNNNILYNDVNGNHISINYNGDMRSRKSLFLSSRMNDGDIWHTWIDYNGDTKILQVRISLDSIYPSTPDLSDTIDLPAILVSQNAFVGFTSATGGGFNDHDILRLRFVNAFKPPNMNLIDDQNFTITENSVPGSYVGTVWTNFQINTAINVQVVNTIPEFVFDPSGRSIRVASFADLDFEKQNSYFFFIKATAFELGVSGIDTLIDTAKMTVNLTDITIPNLLDSQSFSVVEKSLPKTLVGIISLQVPESIGVKVSLIRQVKEFELDSVTRTISVAQDAQLDFMKQQSYQLVVVAKAKDAIDDTAVMKIYVVDKKEYLTVQDASYFDRNSDGYVDSISVSASCENTSGLMYAQVSELVNKSMILPAWRKFTIQRFGLNQGGFYLCVSEDRTHNPVTAVTYDDRILMRATTLSNGIDIKAEMIVVSDRVAPIISCAEKSVFFKDYMNPKIHDTLIVHFSEPVLIRNTQDLDEFFHFFAIKNKSLYRAYLYFADQPKPDKAVFLVSKITGTSHVDYLDSIWIHESDKLSDTVGNIQDNYCNVRRTIFLESVSSPYSLRAKALSPVRLRILSDENTIPHEMVSVLLRQNRLAQLRLSKNQKGYYYGMRIEVDPEPLEVAFYNKSLSLTGTLSIVDPLGNCILSKVPMVWWNERKKLFFIWNCLNNDLRNVGIGSYTCFLEVYDTTPQLFRSNRAMKQVMRLIIGIKE